MNYQNPYFTVTHDCGLQTLPAIPVEQDCTAYRQRRADIAGMIIVPQGGAKAANWTSAADWRAVINNAEAGQTKYVTGIGSLTPQGARVAQLAGGRLQVATERRYTLNFRILHMATGHIALGHLYARTWFKESVWLETVEGRIIGGAKGLQADYTDAAYPFLEGGREQIQITKEFTWPYFPEMALLTGGSPNPEEGAQQFAWGNPTADEIWGATQGWGWEE